MAKPDRMSHYRRMDREQRLVYGEDAQLYDRARPTYPSALIDDVVGLLGRATRVVDAGSGTGKAAVLLAARGLDGVSVEPHPEMARIARRRLEGRRGWRVDISGFEDWTPAKDDLPFDAVVSAQAWHRFKPEVRFEKAHSLLKSGGWLALWWNGPQRFDNPVLSAIDAAYLRHAPEIAHRGVTGHARPSLDPLPPPGSFGSPLERHYPWTTRYTSAEWTDLLRTTSDHRLLPINRLEVLLGAVGEAIDSATPGSLGSAAPMRTRMASCANTSRARRFGRFSGWSFDGSTGLGGDTPFSSDRRPSSAGTAEVGASIGAALGPSSGSA